MTPSSREQPKTTFGTNGMLRTGIMWTSNLLLLDNAGSGVPPHLFCTGAIELAPGEFQGIVKTYDLTHYSDDCKATFMGHTGRVRAVEVMCRGSGPSPGVLCSAGDDASVRFWDIATARCVQTLADVHDGGIQVLRGLWEDSPTLLSGGRDGQIKLWDARQRRSAGCFSHDGDLVALGDFEVQSITTQKKGQSVFSGMSGGGTTGPGGRPRCWIGEWDVRTLQLRTVTGWHRGPIFGLEVVREEDILVSASKDGTLAIRDLRPSMREGPRAKQGGLGPYLTRSAGQTGQGRM